MTEKIIGYTLLILGVAIIFYAAFSTYLVFTKKSEPVKLFNFSGISLDPSQFLPQTNTTLPPEINKLFKQDQLSPKSTQKTELIPPDLLNSSSNVFAHLFLMGFLATIGFKLASLGTMLVRPIVVHLKAKEVAVSDTTAEKLPSAHA